MPIESIDSIDDPRLSWYRGVADPQLLREGGRFVAEGRLVVRRLIETPGFDLESVLLTQTAFDRLADALHAVRERVPVFVAPRALFASIAGFEVHRGCLAIARRPAPVPWQRVTPPAPAPALVVALESIANADNVGGLFRNAWAFGADAVLVDRRTSDPLYRKAIRTSMGASLAVPWAPVDDLSGVLDGLREAGFHLVALTPVPDAQDLEDTAALVATLPRVALLVGNEGAGLSATALGKADVQTRIRMAAGVDSLNVATATGIALHAFARRRGLA